MAQTSFGLSGRFCPVSRPLFQGTFLVSSEGCLTLFMVVSLEPTTPSHRPPIGGQGNVSERSLSLHSVIRRGHAKVLNLPEAAVTQESE